MRIIFFGTPSFAIPALNALLHAGEEVIAVVTQPDKRKGRDRLLSPPPLKDVAVEKGIQVRQPINFKDTSFLDELNSLEPDLIVVVAYGKILPPRILSLPVHGCINIHASLLPNYRGAAPIQWAIIKGEKRTGITTMLMDEGLDTGDILLQEDLDISPDDTADTLGQKLSETGASLLIKTIEKLKDGSLHPVPQTGTPSYAPPLRKKDGRINYTSAAEDIRNMVRGMYPWPCAYCYLNGERIKITRVSVLEGAGLPGRIEKAGDELIVGTGTGLLSIIGLQPEGKRAMNARDFLGGRRLTAGAFFDEP
jgi:methionyl-tRNA formyltransferase